MVTKNVAAAVRNALLEVDIEVRIEGGTVYNRAVTKKGTAAISRFKQLRDKDGWVRFDNLEFSIDDERVYWERLDCKIALVNHNNSC